MIAVSFEGFEKMEAKLKKIADSLRLDRRDMQRIGEFQRQRIIQRVEQRHQDKAGRPFAPYSSKGSLLLLSQS